MLDTFSFSDDKLAVLPSLKDLILDTKNKQTIIDAFDFSSDKDAAAKILKDLQPRSCVYGYVTAKRVHFVVDTSGSMAATFTVDGKGTTRLGYVSAQLNAVIGDQLTAKQSFNVFRFSAGVQPWEKGLMPVTAANIASAESFIGSWSAGGGTNLYAALQTAYATDAADVLAIYLLTDGTPSVGTTDPATIVAAAAKWSKGKTIPTHTVAFLEGNDPSDNKPASRALMQAIAKATGGVYRTMDKSS